MDYATFVTVVAVVLGLALAAALRRRRRQDDDPDRIAANFHEATRHLGEARLDIRPVARAAPPEEPPPGYRRLAHRKPAAPRTETSREALISELEPNARAYLQALKVGNVWVTPTQIFQRTSETHVTITPVA